MSFSGTPLTAGFVGKFYVIAAGVDSSLWLLILLRDQQCHRPILLCAGDRHLHGGPEFPPH